MKKLFFGVIATIVLSLNVSAQESENRGTTRWPFGCRVWTVGINVGVFSMTSEVTLCCAPSPLYGGAYCFEVKSKQRSVPDTVYQFVMIDEIENKLGKKIEESKLEVYNERSIETEDGVYTLKRDFYPIQVNEEKNRFIQLKFEKNK
ncbi:hypothetical protein WFZ85_04805 [Flavobacterium sp. j3]|uniref:DUF4377 domain-containing protein n=1 Tax=Flavobacterium aureirubrum TaxID=3133147 RepID=A0ABU9N2G9_9FLAO